MNKELSKNTLIITIIVSIIVIGVCATLIIINYNRHSNEEEQIQRWKDYRKKI